MKHFAHGLPSRRRPVPAPFALYRGPAAAPSAEATRNAGGGARALTPQAPYPYIVRLPRPGEPERGNLEATAPMHKSKKKTPDAPDAAAAAPPSAPPPAPSPAPAAPPPPAPPAPSPAEAELAAVKDKYLRLMAEFDNFRKRQARERDEFARRANEALLQELLPVLDHLELALASAPDRHEPLAKGVGLVIDQFFAVLARFDLKPFQAAGQPFDPNRHEALTLLPSADVPAHHVAQQVRRGYDLGGRLLRPAQVIVSNGPAPAAPAAGQDAAPPPPAAGEDEDPED